MPIYRIFGSTFRRSRVATQTTTGELCVAELLCCERVKTHMVVRSRLSGCCRMLSQLLSWCCATGFMMSFVYVV